MGLAIVLQISNVADNLRTESAILEIAVVRVKLVKKFPILCGSKKLEPLHKIKHLVQEGIRVVHVHQVSGPRDGPHLGFWEQSAN